MATLAANFRRPEAGMLPRESDARERWSEEPDPYQLRPLPYEDVYFHAKKINNRVMRENDPVAWKKALHGVSVSLVAALVIMILLAPNVLQMVAGYQIHALEKERARLEDQKSLLELEEARELSPEHLQQWARELRMVDPDTAHVLYVNKPEGALALNVAAK